MLLLVPPTLTVFPELFALTEVADLDALVIPIAVLSLVRMELVLDLVLPAATVVLELVVNLVCVFWDVTRALTAPTDSFATASSVSPDVNLTMTVSMVPFVETTSAKLDAVTIPTVFLELFV